MNDKEKGTNNIVQYIQLKQNRIIDDKFADFYRVILAETYTSTKINISNILGNKKIKGYLYSNGFNSNKKVLTNDKLYWMVYFYSNIIQARKIPAIIDSENFKVKLCSLIGIGKSYQESFVYDSSDYFTFVGSKLLTDDQTKEFIAANKETTAAGFSKNDKYEIKNYDYFETTINSLKYIVKTLNNEVMLCYSENNKDNVDDLINNMKFFYKEGQGITAGIKIKTIGKDDKTFYISQDLKLTNFCPGSVYFDKPLPVKILYTFDINLVLAYENIKQKINDEKKEFAITFEDIFGGVYISNEVPFEAVIIFLIILYSNELKNMTEVDLKKKNVEVFKKKIEEIVKYYYDNKEDIEDALTTIKSVCDTLNKFYDSFTNKINYDITKSLQKNLDNIMPDMKSMIEKKLHDKLVTFLNMGMNKIYRGMIAIGNVLTTLMGILVSIQSIIKQLTDLDSDELIPNIRQLGQKIYDLTIDTNSYVFTNTIEQLKTPASFLGNLIGGDVEITLSSISSKVKKEEKMKAKYSTEIVDLMNLITTVSRPEVIAGICDYFYMFLDSKNTTKYAIIEGKSITPTELFSKWYTASTSKVSMDVKRMFQIFHSVYIDKTKSVSVDALKGPLLESAKKLFTSWATYYKKAVAEKDLAVLKIEGDIAGKDIELSKIKDKPVEEIKEKNDEEKKALIESNKKAPITVDEQKSKKLITFDTSTTHADIMGKKIYKQLHDIGMLDQTIAKLLEKYGEEIDIMDLDIEDLRTLFVINNDLRQKLGFDKDISTDSTAAV